MSSKKRYAVVGTGNRARGYITALADEYRDVADLVAFCDASPTRIAAYNELLAQEYGTAEIPGYSPDDFDRMVREQKPDTVIVTTTDATHHIYVVRAMELDCDVICEKPLTTDADKANQILKAKEQSGRDLTVTFNMRYNPKVFTVKRLLREG
ncbi:MAG: Gfo/Idh/MocA family protein, partial [Phycisphaeraceae bacterium]